MVDLISFTVFQTVSFVLAGSLFIYFAIGLLTAIIKKVFEENGPK